jgi:hypothetical protein
MIQRIESDARIQYGMSLVKLARALNVPVAEIAGPNQHELVDALEYVAGTVAR